MKRTILSLVAVGIFAISAQAGIYLKYENKDSKKYTFKVKTCGQTQEVTFESSTTGASIVQSGCDDGVILETSCGDVKVKRDDKVTIKDGCVKVN